MRKVQLLHQLGHGVWLAATATVHISGRIFRREKYKSAWEIQCYTMSEFVKHPYTDLDHPKFECGPPW